MKNVVSKPHITTAFWEAIFQFLLSQKAATVHILIPIMDPDQESLRKACSRVHLLAYSQERDAEGFHTVKVEYFAHTFISLDVFLERIRTTARVVCQKK